MEDIAPKLLEKIQEDFHGRLQENKRLQELLELVNTGKATYVQAEEAAYEMGVALSQAFDNNISSATLPDGKMYYNIAQRVIQPMLEENHRLAAEVATQVQESLNAKAQIGLKPQSVAVDEDRVYGIVNKISEAETFDDVAWMLGEPVVNFSQSVVDAVLRENVSFQGKAGLTPKIIRKAERKCCKWCSSLAGEYRYPDVPHDVYRRHERCRCQVDYDPGTGKRQNVHTKMFTESEDTAKMEIRKVLGLRANGVTIKEISNHTLERMSSRNVIGDWILDAITDPLEVKDVKTDDQDRKSITMVGRKATVIVNPDTGSIVTTYPTHTKTVNKLLRKKGMK